MARYNSTHLQNENKWTDEEDEKLRSSVIISKQKNWRIIAENVGTKSPKECQQRWKSHISPDVLRVKGRWTRDEDCKLIELVKKYGTKNWRFIASHLNGRLPKQCRERWCNQLDPSIKKDILTQEEWRIVKDAHEKYGNRWSEISKLLPGRTANHVKNQWNTMLRRQLFDVSINSDDDEDFEVAYNPIQKRRSHRSDDSNSSSASSKKRKSDSNDDCDIDDSQSSVDSNDTISIQMPPNDKNGLIYFPFFAALVDASCSILQKKKNNQKDKMDLLPSNIQNQQFGKNCEIKPMLPSFNHHMTSNFTSKSKMNHGSVLYNF